ncbi:MAG: DUF4083 family protein [Clostridia bacterium]|nr:DUF4083 family protein [Clostridia bacterium]
MTNFLMGFIVFDTTLVFQMINSLLLLAIIIGIPIIIIKMMRNSKSRNEEMKRLNEKMDTVIEALKK